ncbi:zinc transporter ZIP1-like [Polypterus senegalus]|uniref:zinc transporter ZIP1-like n=1 Tax=Polypterus senegalus TaxID=55291 RepID=UPI0019652F50|nr:zinc transporter ZIP1-like [Polypterus senegalus]
MDSEKGSDTTLESVETMTGLEVKLISLVILLLVTMLFGFGPFFMIRFSGVLGIAPGTCRRNMSLVSCFAGGVFLATCLLDLVPDYLAGITETFNNLQVTLVFPLPEFIMTMGFFLVLIMEQVVLAYKDQSLGSIDERRNLLVASNIQSGNSHEAERDRDEGVHLHVDFNSHSAIRTFILVFSLSLHSIFEGLAVGLQKQTDKVLEICLALLIHKCIIAFSLTFKLVQNHLRRGVVVMCILLFSVMSPLGIGLGILLTENTSSVHQLSHCVLEGIATGTFIYITFMEILPHELASSELRIPKLAMLLLGFTVVTGVLFIRF